MIVRLALLTGLLLTSGFMLLSPTSAPPPAPRGCQTLVLDGTAVFIAQTPNTYLSKSPGC